MTSIPRHWTHSGGSLRTVDRRGRMKMRSLKLPAIRWSAVQDNRHRQSRTFPRVESMRYCGHNSDFIKARISLNLNVWLNFGPYNKSKSLAKARSAAGWPADRRPDIESSAELSGVDCSGQVNGCWRTAEPSQVVVLTCCLSPLWHWRLIEFY